MMLAENNTAELAALDKQALGIWKTDSSTDFKRSLIKALFDSISEGHNQTNARLLTKIQRLAPNVSAAEFNDALASLRILGVVGTCNVKDDAEGRVHVNAIARKQRFWRRYQKYVANIA